MKQEIAGLISDALQTLQQQGTLPELPALDIHIEHTRDKAHGDFASNIAMMLAKPARMAPRQIAELIVGQMDKTGLIEKVEIAGPGFINVTLASSANLGIISTILKEKDNFGKTNIGDGRSVHLEFVSANPTGPLHVGHGRSAAYGACVGNLLKAVGFNVHREYYVNDAGRQMRILALSTWIRYLQTVGEDITLPGNAYQGDYITDIAKALIDLKGEAYSSTKAAFDTALAAETFDATDKEQSIDAAIRAAKSILGEESFLEVKQFALDAILNDIKDDLGDFGVHYDEWYPESQLYGDGSFDEGIALLESEGHVYEKGGAKWFRATTLGDEKDRVLIRDNGQPTYFASDVAYHLHSYNNYDDMIDIFGADHHGYIPRLRAFLKGLGKNPDKLNVLLVQFAVLYRGKEKVAMSTRSGDFVTLRELREEVGNDAARFFYIMRKPDQHLDFDLELALKKNNENPVYYIQYAHARICSVMRKLTEQGYTYTKSSTLDALTTSHEQTLLTCLTRYPEALQAAAKNYAPHTLSNYLYELSNAFHTYYNAEVFIIDDEALRNARLSLILATQHVIKNGMSILGVSCPDAM
jgi:arginyl-tRNA synthetase